MLRHEQSKNEERLRHRTGMKDTNMGSCSNSWCTRGGIKDKQKNKVDLKQSEEGRVSTERAEKTPAFCHVEHTCLFLLMGQKELHKQKFLHPTHTPLSQRCVLIINRLGSKPLSWGGEKVGKNRNQTGRFLWGHYQFHTSETF